MLINVDRFVDMWINSPIYGLFASGFVDFLKCQYIIILLDVTKILRLHNCIIM